MKKLLISNVSIIVFFLLGCENTKVNDSKGTSVNESKDSTSIRKASMDEIEIGIKQHIDQVAEEFDGYFPIKNDSIDMKMKLVRVHTEYLSNLGSGKYFACVDLADQNGDVFDVDFFLEGTPGNMEVVNTSVHKLNGKPYYVWKQNKEDKTWYQVPVENADNKLLGIIEGNDEFEFYYSVTLPEIQGNAKLWIPIAQNDEFQEIETISMELPEEEEVLFDKQFGNKSIYLALDNSHSNKSISIKYKVNRQEKGTYSAKENEDMSQYLVENTLIPVDDNFKKIALEAIGEISKDEVLIRARALYDHVIDNMEYIKDGSHGTGDAVYACDVQSGNCSEFHSYFIALARSVGIPARFAIGAAIPADRDDGGVDGYHCWAEFYAEDKWWPVDISEANKYSALATYYFGHHPANRIELSKGRDLEFEKLPETGPINFFAFPVMEIDGVNFKPKTEFKFNRE